MIVSDCLNINQVGHLTIGGKDAVELAATFGTPLYVMDESQIRAACRSYKASIDDNYGGRGMVAYAGKAFSCKAMCRLMKEEGMGLDVVSGGELYTAMSVGFPAEKILFHGNNKTPEELAYALQCKVGRIVVDNIYELELLNQMAMGTGRTADIMFRIKPGVDAHTHDMIRTGSIDSKFGFALEAGEAFAAAGYALSLSHIRLMGLHCHIGSQIFDIEPFELAARIMLDLMAKIREELGYTIKELNLGGGFGVKYVPSHDPVAYGQYMSRVAAVVKKTCAEKGMETPFIIIEPGRSIAGPAGITLYTVGGVKEIPGIRTYVSVDGGMGDNPRYSLYKSEYEMLLANKAEEAKSRAVTVAGKCCETDLLGKDILIQEPAVGDILAVLVTGAYNYSMSSNYNRYPRPPVVMITDGEAHVVVKRETYEDVTRSDI
jgi:diaminopimelate decarboxylase